MNYQNVSLRPIIEIAIRAGKEVMQVYRSDFTVESKNDRSPITEADRKANKIIIEGLKALHPDIPFISEETKQTGYSERQNWNLLWLIDPIDGTKEFVKRNGEFTVNIALVENAVPVLGVVLAPAKNIGYAALRGTGAFKFQPGDDPGFSERTLVPLPDKHTHYKNLEKVRVVTSRSHLTPETTRFIRNLEKDNKKVEVIASGSSLKICLVAEGAADVYPRFGPTMEWDTAAAHAIALLANRRLLNTQTHQPLTYNKPDLKNPYFIVE